MLILLGRYIITELASGGDLYSLLLRYDRLDERGIRSIIRQVLHGVSYMHSKGVAHRDIKPENILCGITPRVPYRIMLSDLGDSAVAGGRRMKSNVGTRFYRPPCVKPHAPTKTGNADHVFSECNTPGQGHDLSVDIWAIGVLALQLFLGYEEFPGLDSVVFGSQKEIDTYVGLIFTVLSHRGFISEAAKSFIRECMAYDSKRRPTARKAFYHDWLQEPRADRQRFKRLEADNVLSWKPQQVKIPIIEKLTVESLGESENRKTPAQKRSALDDFTSRHFMDHHQLELKFNMVPSGQDEIVYHRPSPPTIGQKRKAVASEREC